jgi:hypothetical protein
MDRALLSFVLFPSLFVPFSGNSFDRRALFRNRNHDGRNGKPVKVDI